MKKINLFILVLLLFNSCDKYDESSFNYTVSVNKTEFQIGEKIRINIQGGMSKSLIYPVLAKYNSNEEYVEHLNLISSSTDGDCCNYETPYWSDYALICNCDVDGVIVHTPDSSQTYDWNSGSYVYTFDEFYLSDDQFRVLIIDPFIDQETGERIETESITNKITSNNSIICESDFFSINNISSTCSSPQNLIVSSGLTTATLSWDIVSEADHYSFRYRTLGSGTWNNGNTYNTNEQELSALDPNSEYEWQVQTICNQVGSEVSAWASGNTFSTLSSTPCYILNCGSLSQLSDYEAYTSNGSSSWTSEWVINSSNGSNNGSYFATQGSYCTGGFIEFDINLTSPSRMSYYARKNNYTAASAQIKVDGISFGQATLPSDIFDINYFGHYMTNDFISPGNHTIRLEFPAGGTFNTYYLDEIEFFCE
jgi:hypothetical protein